MNQEDRVEACARQLLAAVQESGRWVSGDARVHEDTAAELLGIAPATLANKRADGTAPPHYKVGGRVTYRLGDLAAYIEGCRYG